MRVTLNFATRPYADLGPVIKQLRVTMAILAVVAVSLGLFLHMLHSKAEAARASNRSLDGQISRIIQEQQGYRQMMQLPDNAQALAKVQALNRIFDEKAFSWTLAMEDLETVLPARVQVSNLEPARSKDGHITLHMRVIGPRDKGLQLVSNLEHSKRFVLPSIVGESAESQGGPNEAMEPVSMSNRVDFDLLAQYTPATLEERKSITKPTAKTELTTSLRALTSQTPKVRHPAINPATNAAARSASAHRTNEAATMDAGDRSPRPSARPARPYPGQTLSDISVVRPNAAARGQQ